LGATLINDDFDVSKPYLVPKRTKLNNNLPFRTEIKNLRPFCQCDYDKLNAAVANAFDVKEN
jgi:hypothetical protein